MLIHDLDLQHIPARQRKQVFEPKTRYDFVKVIASIVNRPIPQMLRLTKHIPDDWFFEIQSWCKEKTKEQQAKYIWYFIRESRPKEVEPKTLT